MVPKFQNKVGVFEHPGIFLRWLVLACILWGLAACSSTPDPSALHPTKKRASAPAIQKSEPPSRNYVGLQVPPMPKAHESEIGYLLEPEGQGKYAIEIVSFGTQKIVWMERFLFHDDKGKAHWKIIAALPPHPIPEGYFFSSGNCMRQGQLQPEIVAILKREDKPMLTHIHKAWRAFPLKGIFEELPRKEIHCINESWTRL